MIVVKVGGSLFGHPQLGPGLREFLAMLPGQVVLVPGGGAIADTVRELDRIHTLGEEAAHWLALKSLRVSLAFLEQLTHGLAPGIAILDCYAFAQEDESRPGALPHTWAVTTDSIAARFAEWFDATELILLKSTDIPPHTPWNVATRNGWVDEHFATVVARTNYPIRVVNFLARLEARASQ